MAIILNIETATPVCSVSIAKDGELIASKELNSRNSHSSVITLFIEELMKEKSLDFKDLDAVAVSMGPGSYTGLRIGVSTAKGICFAVDKPLIAVSTLQAMAAGMVSFSSEINIDDSTLFCPMIDARRMEVYTALYSAQNEEVEGVHNKIIDEESFSEILSTKRLIFGGDGADKCKDALNGDNCIYLDEFYPSAKYMAKISEEKFQKELFEDVAYFEPYYLKDFVAGISKVKGLR
jgi:tRNA threonylcarbamoyladenosine biosynthesis protein TsaB